MFTLGLILARWCGDPSLPLVVPGSKVKLLPENARWPFAELSSGGSFDLGHLFEGVALTNRDSASSSDTDLQASDSQVKATVGRSDRSTALRFAGLGIELATSTLLFAGIGYFVDWLLQLEKSYGTAAGTLFGFTIGMFRFIQQALKGTGDSPS